MSSPHARYNAANKTATGQGENPTTNTHNPHSTISHTGGIPSRFEAKTLRPVPNSLYLSE